MFVDSLDILSQFFEHGVVADPLTGMAEEVGDPLRHLAAIPSRWAPHSGRPQIASPLCYRPCAPHLWLW